MYNHFDYDIVEEKFISGKNAIFLFVASILLRFITHALAASGKAPSLQGGYMHFFANKLFAKMTGCKRVFGNLFQQPFSQAIKKGW